MNKNTWEKFAGVRKRFKSFVAELDSSFPQLRDIQQKLVDNRAEISYKIETPVVYNSALDEVTSESEIRLILVGDNPGRREQEAENRRYLVGPSGKIARKFFSDNPSLKIDFTKNVIILNKTPIHTPRTNDLRHLALYLEESQIKMADLLLEFQETLGAPVFITGYSEMRKGGIFEAYTERLKRLYQKKQESRERLLIFRHFSMNQFTTDLKQKSLPGETVEKTLSRVGKAYRERVFGNANA